MKVSLVSAAAFLLAASFLSAAAPGAISVGSLRCEYLDNPLGIDETQPRLSWIDASPRRGERQTAYQILVATSPEQLAKDRGDLWDSGEVRSAENAHIVYAGRPLASREAAWWKVRVWDRDGNPSAWSEPARWEMGLRDAKDWTAQWIEAPKKEIVRPVQPLGKNPVDDLKPATWIWSPEPGVDLTEGAPLGERFFYRLVSLPADAKLKRATLVATADDSFSVSVNGREVKTFDEGDNWKRPQVFDLTKFFRPGKNELRISATNRVGFAGLCAVLGLDFDGAESQVVVTDRRWKAAPRALAAADSGWSEAVEVAPFGKGSWGDLGAYTPHPVPIFRRAFELADKPVKHARIYASALGIYELALNGKRVGDRELAPEFTDYDRRVFYQTYDVTGQVHAGGNVLTGLLADGWYSGHVAWRKEIYGKHPALRAQLEVTYADGTNEVIGTDGKWKTRESAILAADLLMGEIYDARREDAAVDRPAYDDKDWSPAIVREEKARTLVAQPSEPVRVTGEIPAKSIAEPKPGNWVIDMGQNMVGWVRLAATAPRGTEVTLRFGEMLNPDGTLYTANLRAARATDVYTFKGTGREAWEPRFTFHGFRYVEITGLPEKPSLDTVRGIVVGSDTPRTGSFACSDPRLNQLQSNIVWGQHGNFLSVPTDCPQRDERLGWMGDAQVFIRTATENADVAAFFTKWMVDVNEAQTDDGRFSDVAPKAVEGSGVPGWGDAGVICPWTIYQVYGDTRILERSYSAMVKWVEWCRSQSTDLIRDRERGNDYGDWLSISADTPKDLIGTAYFAYSTDLLARTAAVLGKTDDAKKYRQLFEDIKAAFAKRYLQEDGRIAGNTQCGYAMALQFDLVPTKLRPAAVRHLVEDIKAKGDHLSTGFLGVSYLLPVLTNGGEVDVAFRLLRQDTFPSWLFSVKHGATTIWERWDGWTPEKGFQDVGMNSFNHYSLGSCGQWMFDSLAGIGLDPASPAYRRIVFAPQIGGGLTQARASVLSMRGPISAEWKLAGDEVSFDCAVPVGSTASVVLPGANVDAVREGGQPVDRAEGVTFDRAEAGKVYLSVGPGTYRFTSRAPKR